MTATSLQEAEVPYKEHTGHDRLTGDPMEGQVAWFDLSDPRLGREKRVFRDGCWIPDPETTDAGL